MIVILNLSNELQARLFAQAQANGMTVEAFLLSVVEGAVLPTIHQKTSAEERALAFEAWSVGHRATTPPLSDYAVSRYAIYEGRDS